MDGSSTFDARSLVHSATPLHKPAGSDGGDGIAMAEYDYAPKTFVLRANHKDDFVTPYAESEEKAQGRQQRLQMQNGLLRWASRGAGLRMSRSLKMHGRKFLRKHDDSTKSHHVELPARARTVHDHGRHVANPPNNADASSVRSAASSAARHPYPQAHNLEQHLHHLDVTDDIVNISGRPSADTSRDDRDGADLERKGTYLLTDSPVRRNNFELPMNISEEERIANAVRVGAGVSSTQALVSDMRPVGGEGVSEGGDVAEGNYAAYAAYADARSSLSAARHARGPGSAYSHSRGLQVPLPVQFGEGDDIDPLRATPSPSGASGYFTSPPPPPVPRVPMMPSDSERQYGPSSYANVEMSNGNGRPQSAVRGPRARRASPEATRHAEPTVVIENDARGTPSSAHAYQGSHARHGYPISITDEIESPALGANTGVIIVNMEDAETTRAPGGPLTTANIFRHNHAMANDSSSLMPVGGARGEGRQSMLNPLVHTFTSPIGEHLFNLIFL